jgi:hypothetical protein
MRAILALTLAVTGLALQTHDAEAASEHYRYRGKVYRITKTCDHTCVRARSLDPAGTYAAYPDWARAALSPKTSGGGRRH